MALMSMVGSSLHSEMIRCKAGCTNSGNNLEAFKMKDMSFGLNFSSWNSSQAIQGWRLNCIGAGYRRHKLIVAASPPTEDVVSTEPLTKKDLIDYLTSGCKPKEKWRL